MADAPKITDHRDRERIIIHEEYEVRYWSKELGVSTEKLKETVEKVGVMARDVRRALSEEKTAMA